MLSKKGQDFAIRSMKIQDHVVGVHLWNINSSIRWVTNNVTVDDIQTLISAFFTASMCAYWEINVLADLFVNLMTQPNFPAFKCLPELLVNHIFLALRRVDPYPLMTGPLCLLFHLKNKNIIPSEVIVRSIKAFYDTSKCKSNACLPFCWFAPEILELQPELFSNILSILKKKSEDDFFHEAYKNFIHHLDDYQQDNWKFYRESLPKNESLDPIINSIREDNAQTLGSLVDGVRITDIQKVEPEVFDPCSYACDSLSLGAYSCVYGAVKIFHTLKQSRAIFLDDKESRKLPLFATVGHSISIASFFEDKQDMAGVLQSAALSHSNITLDYYLRRGLDPNELDRFGRVPLSCAAAADNVYGAVRLLLAGASLDAREAFGWTALHTAAERGSTTVLRVLLEAKGADVNAADIWGMTALHVAVDRGQEAAARILLDCPSADSAVPAEGGRTPAHTAARGASLAILRMLTERGADLNARTARGKTPLHFAAESGSADIVAYLASKRNVKKDARDYKGRTPKDIAEARGDPEIIKCLLTKVKGSR